MKKQPQKTRLTDIHRNTLLGWALAFVIGVMMLLQLFTFEKFPSLLVQTGLGQDGAAAMAIGIVLLELVTLPVLLGVVRGRYFKIAALVGVIVLMVMLGCLNFAGAASGQSVAFGATLSAPAGAWSITFFASIILLALWWYIAMTPQIQATQKPD